MTSDDLFRIKKFLTLFFVCALMIQFGLVCYASGNIMPASEVISLQLQHIERISWVSVLSISLNLVVIVVAVYGVNLSIINSMKD